MHHSLLDKKNELWYIIIILHIGLVKELTLTEVFKLPEQARCSFKQIIELFGTFGFRATLL